jgi:hypothetical protein
LGRVPWAPGNTARSRGCPVSDAGVGMQLAETGRCAEQGVGAGARCGLGHGGGFAVERGLQVAAGAELRSSPRVYV